MMSVREVTGQYRSILAPVCLARISKPSRVGDKLIFSAWEILKLQLLCDLGIRVYRFSLAQQRCNPGSYQRFTINTVSSLKTSIATPTHRYLPDQSVVSWEDPVTQNVQSDPGRYDLYSTQNPTPPPALVYGILRYSKSGQPRTLWCPIHRHTPCDVKTESDKRSVSSHSMIKNVVDRGVLLPDCDFWQRSISTTAKVLRTV